MLFRFPCVRSAAAARTLLFGACALGAFQACKKDAAAPAPQAAAAPQAAPAAEGLPPAAAEVKDRVEVAVTEEGFVPSRIPAKTGKALTLAITRKTERTCANEILFEGQEGKTDLPLNKTVEVTYTPKATGEVKFGCGMGMMLGGVVAVVD